MKVIRNINELKEKVSLVEYVSRYVALTRQGNRWIGLSPFKPEKTPSFHIHERNGAKFKDFSSGNSGDIIDFFRLMNPEITDFNESLKKLCEEMGYKYAESRKVIQRNEENRIFFDYNEILKENLLNSPNTLKILEERRITVEDVKEFGLGFSEINDLKKLKNRNPEKYTDKYIEEKGLIKRTKNKKGEEMTVPLFWGRITTPIENKEHNIIGYSGRETRKPDNPVKYLNSRNLPKDELLYGLSNEIKKKGFCFITEGTYDVIALKKAGQQAVCGLGANLTQKQVELLEEKTNCVILAFDSDEAGLKATERAGHLLQENGFMVKVLQFPEGKDAEEFINSLEKENVEENFYRYIIDNSKSFFEHMIEKYCEEEGKLINEFQKREPVEKMREFFRRTEPIEKYFYIEKFAKILKLPTEEVKEYYKEEFMLEELERKFERNNELCYVKNKRLKELEKELFINSAVDKRLAETESIYVNPVFRTTIRKLKANKKAREKDKNIKVTEGLNGKELAIFNWIKEGKVSERTIEEIFEEHKEARKGLLEIKIEKMRLEEEKENVRIEKELKKGRIR